MIRAISRPARIESAVAALDEEMCAARYLYHRLLDFEDEHQRVLDATAERVAPGITRAARIVARLLRRQERRERTTRGQWSPNPHAAWLASVRVILSGLRDARNKAPVWAEACKWSDTPADDAPDRGGVRRKKGESDEQFAERTAKRRNKLTRREAWRKALYDAHVAAGATERSRVYWGTWNALLRSVDQARAAVLKQRKSGIPAELRRPRRDDRISICADSGGFRIVDRGGGTKIAKSGATVGNPWWTIEMRLASGWVRFRAKCANWHAIPDDAEFRTCSLTRDRGGYSVSIVVRGLPDELDYSVGHTATTRGRRELLDGRGVVALDWGHREHGHPGERVGLRVFTWLGDDGDHGEILLPIECRELLDDIDATKARMDDTFNARKSTLELPDRNRYTYRARLMRLGVVTEEQARWLSWETRYERRLTRMRDRIDSLRRETYIQAARKLRQKYKTFLFEDEKIANHRKQAIEDQSLHRKRQNRELSARYLFTQLCERLGADVITVTARNSTRECPDCGYLCENGPELEVACPSCGVVRDKDLGACAVIMRRGKEALAKVVE